MSSSNLESLIRESGDGGFILLIVAAGLIKSPLRVESGALADAQS
jgi:hypothetical protein